MAELEQPREPERLNLGRLVAAGLAVAGCLFALVTTLWVLARFVELSRQSEPPPVATDFMAAVVVLLAGWAFGMLLWGVGQLLRRFEDLLELLRATMTASSTGGLPTALSARGPDAGRGPEERLLEELVRLTREVRDIELLSEEERRERLRAESSELAGRLESEIPALLREHKLHEARQRLQRARSRFPSLPRWKALAEQVEQARAKFEAHDIDVATREVDDLIALAAWDRAVEVVRDLRRRHPSSDKVAELDRRLATTRERATAEERARLMSQAQDATTRREWRDALRLVETVLERFPNSAEARDLRLQVPTLKANIEVLARQEMETRIRDLIKEQRFREGLAVARELIQSYPHSPQATVLREQLPRLEQRAAESAGHTHTS